MANGDQNKHADALAALHGDTQDKPKQAPPAQPAAHQDHDEAMEAHVVEDDHAAANTGTPSPGESSTSGLVSMLAKNEFEKNNRPTPKPGAGQGNSQTGRVAARTDEIRMAKEIEVRPAAPKPASGVPNYQSPRRVARKVPGWYHTAIPVMFTISSLLSLIGMWALGAVIAMMAKAQSYPLLRYDDFVGEFTRSSKLFAWVMVMCLPIAILLIISAIVMQRQIAAARLSQEAANARKPQATTPI